jgi:hypothetical protein
MEPRKQKKTWRYSAPIDMFLSAVSVLVVVQLSSEVPEGLMNNPVLCRTEKSLTLAGNRLQVKCTLVQALRFRTDRATHIGSRGIALLFHDQGTWRGWGVSVTPRLLFTPRKDPVPLVQEAGWAPGPDWTGGGKSCLHRHSIPEPSSP